MAKPDIETIVDHEGEVWTGAVTGREDHFVRDTVLRTFVPITLLMGPSEPTVTVKVNGEEHSGTRLNSR